ncbi:hypothetical protein, partial [Paludifilum halophilum]|uniref:hypothetical protein n=1 Tax=Paludifilum halophilum TaxID=1642702 RepID=UPI0019814DCA
FDDFSNIEVPIARVNEMISYVDEGIEGVQPYIFRRGFQGPRGKGIKIVSPFMHLSPQPL